MSQQQQMNAQKAREIVRQAQDPKALHWPRGAGKTTAHTRFVAAQNYLSALSGPKVKALVDAAEKVSAHYNHFHSALPEELKVRSAGVRLIASLDEALALYQKSTSQRDGEGNRE